MEFNDSVDKMNPEGNKTEFDDTVRVKLQPNSTINSDVNQVRVLKLKNYLMVLECWTFDFRIPINQWKPYLGTYKEEKSVTNLASGRMYYLLGGYPFFERVVGLV